ncbi:MAG: hypothetical protein LUH15_00345 [Tannerellaceae bacterium]|nr:hypothetical protein [Tannerellaceae bacterium]
MNNLRKITIILLLACLSFPLFAQIEELKVYNLKSRIQAMENATYRILYYNGQQVCTYGDKPVFAMPKMQDMAIIPSAASIAVIDKKRKGVYLFMR